MSNRDILLDVVIHGANFNVAGSVLNCDKLTQTLIIEEWTVNFTIKIHSESISISVTEKFGFEVHLSKYLKHLMRLFFSFLFCFAECIA